VRSHVQRSPQASGGVAVLAGETRARSMTRKGYYAPGAWDVYWTGRQARPLCMNPTLTLEQGILSGLRTTRGDGGGGRACPQGQCEPD